MVVAERRLLQGHLSDGGIWAHGVGAFGEADDETVGLVEVEPGLQPAKCGLGRLAPVFSFASALAVV